MTWRIVTIDRTATGRDLRRERMVEAAELVAGRSPECALHLPDLAIEQRHLLLEQLADGRVQARALGTLGFIVEGRSAAEHAFDVAVPVELVLGRWKLECRRDGDGCLAVTVRQVAEAEDRAGREAGFALGHVMPGKRPMAWAGLVAILLAFLAIPIWSHLTREPAPPDARRPGLVLADAAWSTGALSSVHHGLEDQCEACHAKPFEAVRDNTCLSCHADIADHAALPRQNAARGPLSPGDAIQWRIAHAMGKPGPGACTDCHTEHEGAGRMEPARQQFCSDCHATMDRRLTDTALANAADFGTIHPQLQPAIFSTPGQKEPVRTEVSPAIRHWTGLTFPHRLHLDARGGVARMAQRLGTAQGYGQALDCADCHTRTADGAGFLPVDMEADCESCHSLVYDKVGSTFRTLRHGDVAQARADLVALDRAPYRPIAGARQRPGQFGSGGTYRANFGDPRSGATLLAGAMGRDGLCGQCHVPARNGAQLAVMPVMQQGRFLLPGTFDHEEHRKEPCASCHKAAASSTSADLLLPGIAQCRTCHLGEAAAEAEVPSGCAMCHSYHPGAVPPAGHGSLSSRQPATRPAGRRREVQG